MKARAEQRGHEQEQTCRMGDIPPRPGLVSGSDGSEGIHSRVVEQGNNLTLNTGMGARVDGEIGNKGPYGRNVAREVTGPC
jgi:hypothetical protein